MSDHALLAPSSAARRVVCPGSRQLESLYPDKDSPHAKEGEAAHWVASELLKTRKEWPECAPNGETLTAEMFDGAKTYVNAIYEVLQPARIDWLGLHIEERVSIASIHPQCWGTPDAWVFDPGKSQVHIWDYKFGHMFVEVFENWQLIEYAAGILDKLGINGIYDQRTFVNFYIIQPRSYHRDGCVRRWTIRASDLRPYFNILHHAEHKAMEDKAPCKPSPECSFCTARHACTALQRSALAAVDLAGTAIAHDLNAEATGSELRLLERAALLLDARITGLKEQALAMIRRGENVAWYSAEPTVGRQRWTRPPEEVKALGELMGYSLVKPDALITPLQAINLGLDESIVASISERPTGALKLVADDGTNARKIFSS